MSGRGTRRVGALLFAALLMLTSSCGESGDAATASELLVAAASDVRPAFERLGAIHKERTGVRVTFTFGSSGQLAEQVKNGAPFNLFASANDRFVEEVVAAGRGDRSSVRTYAGGRLALWWRDGARPARTVADLAGLTFRRIAIANPEHAPYGVAAVDALRKAGVYDAVKERLVYGENVADTMRLASTGNADVAIGALSLAKTLGGGVLSEVPPSAHAPIRQTLVVTGPRSDWDAGRAFAALVTGADGKRVLHRHGFLIEDRP